MNLRKARLATVAAVSAATFLLAMTSAAAADRAYRVTITNLTRGQVFSPPVVALHDDDVAVFRVGEPASDELAALAEDGMADPLAALLRTTAGVYDVAIADGPIPPGQSRSVVLHAAGPSGVITAVGMLVTTNDGFFGAHVAEAPGIATRRPLVSRARRAEVAYGNAYDAGTEANTEMCAEIPGPPCGNAGVRHTDGAEGFVHVHAGIHGIGDLDPAATDWRNPVVRLTVEPLP